MPRHHHIINAASNLLGIALIVITGLHLGGFARRTVADELAWGAAAAHATACLLSYMAIRVEPAESPYERWADRVFFAGLVLLLVAVLVLASARL